MSDMTIQINNQNWYIVKSHSIPDKKEVKNLIDLHVDARQQKYYGLNNIRLQRQISQLAVAKKLGIQ
jgi:hypothetical protein